MQSVAGKTVLVTGAAMGMGKLFAMRAVREGAGTVVLWDVNADALEATAAELAASGGRVHTQVVNVAERDALERAVAETRARVGTVQVLINNAGVVVGAYFWDHSDEQITRTLAINTLAPMLVVRAFLPGMIAATDECRIVNIASAAGLVANPRMSVYCASKWALIGWSDSLRLELERAGHRHVQVTTVTPSYISTGMFDGVRPPFLTPILVPEVVVAKVWDAMKTGQPFVRMPWTVHFVQALKGLVPTRVFDFVTGSLFGVYTSMDDFRGRGPKA